MIRRTSKRLREVLKSSPANVVDGLFWYSKLAADAPSPTDSLATFRDDVELTVVSGRKLSPESRGPFHLIRLEVVVPFESPGSLRQ